MMPMVITISGHDFLNVRQLDDWVNPELAEITHESWDSLSITPLQQVMGITASEEEYDSLPLREQLILDLLMAGWNQTQIAKVFDLSQSTISVTQKRIRYHLANSKLRLILESRGKEA